MSLRTAGRGFAAVLTLGWSLAALDASPPAHAQQPGEAEKTIEFKPELPVDVNDGTGDFSFIHDPANIPEAQQIFDRFAWRLFVGMNWPTKADGQPDPAISLKQDAVEGAWRPRVWQTLAEANSLFQRYGAAPQPWTSGAYPGTFEADHYEPLTLWMYSKINNRHALNRTQIVDESLQAFTGPLVDQQGLWVRYKVYVNRTSYEYIRRNGLYSLEGQARFAADRTVSFPVDGDKIDGETFTAGTTEVKFAWKQLATYDEKANGPFVARDYDFSKNDGFKQLASKMTWNSDPSRFLVRWSYIIHNEAPTKDGVPQPDPVPVPMGMVGMHIATKTRSSPEWIWATFEHVDNVQTNDLSFVHIGGKKQRLRPIFNNPDLPTKIPNVLAPKNSRPDATGAPTDWDESLTTTPVQVTRVIPIPLATQQVNRESQRALAGLGSVFQYYELIGAQWPVRPNFPAFPSGNNSAPESIVFKTPGQMVPVYVANTTMETFFQLGVQAAGPLAQDDRLPPKQVADPTLVFGTESCVGCHYSAGMCLGFKRDAEGKLLMNEGNKVPIFGINSNAGRTGNADFSWLLQMKAQSEDAPKSTAVPAAVRGVKGAASLNDPGSDPEKNLPK
ncbi:hypothetical protein [Paludisphaera rhizosphaerae]|uniref:hypothetical protein n=1 Tax=Paludisphaera rhizosphaerae TaxID=2711216 RepID=UPI0013ECB399|nr:hypothetical protein [Paludisphaera rhizosphaerae]